MTEIAFYVQIALAVLMVSVIALLLRTNRLLKALGRHLAAVIYDGGRP